MEISKAPEKEVEISQRELEIRKQEEKLARKTFLENRKKDLKALKEDVDWLKTNYEYRQYRILLNKQEADYVKVVQAEEEFLRQQRAAKESVPSEEKTNIKDNVADSNIGTDVEEPKS